MPFDERLAERVREVMDGTRNTAEMKMFGGMGILIRGNIAVGVFGDELIVRCGPDDYEKLLAKPNAREFDITGRAMSGWLLVDPAGLKTKKQLSTWIERGVSFASTLPAKKPKERKPRPKKA